MRCLTLPTLTLLLACSGGDTDPTDTSGVGAGDDTAGFDDGRVWPEAEWAEGEPADHGVDAEGLEALAEYTFRPNHSSQALAVFKDGVLVGEWYADGYDADSLVTSWSAAKSVTSALVGVGVGDGLLTLDDTVGSHLDAWANGPNSAVTLHDLLTMQSGLTENTSNPSGIYLENTDQLAYALDRELVREPGTEYEYVNEDSMVIAGVVSEVFGEEAADVAQRELFEPMGMSAEWWVDGSGHTLGYCCIDSTARDMARFGLLYARDGAWQGEQLVPADYVEQSGTGVSYNGYYGLHWWVFEGGMAAIGLHGQLVVALPEQDMVVVRFGQYERVGDEAVRTGSNYHSTEEEGNFDQGRFMELVWQSLEA